MPIVTTFDENEEGWTSTSGPVGWDEHASIIVGSEGGSGVWQFVAPDTYLGDQESYYGGTVAFTLSQLSGINQFDSADVTLIGGGVTLLYDFPNNPATTATTYEVQLEVFEGWRVGSLTGPVASEAQIRAVLADLTSFTIRGEFVSGVTDDTTALHDVAWTEGAVNFPDTQGARIISPFFGDYDGWSFTGEVSEFEHVRFAAGHTGYLSASDYDPASTWYFLAPDAYLGDRSEFYGGALSFTMQQSSTSDAFDDDDIIIVGSGITLARDLPAPGTEWTDYSIRLDTSAEWRVGSEDGPLATEHQIRLVLGDIQSLRIRGDFSTAPVTLLDPHTTQLDVVEMEMFHEVEHFDGAGFGTLLGRYPSFADAVGQLSDGDSIRVTGAPAEPTSPRTAVAQDNLTIEAVHTGYRLAIDLVDDARTLTVLGLGNFTVHGSGGDDILQGSSTESRVVLYGRAGNDSGFGGSGNDFMYGGEGDDLLVGGVGRDILLGELGNDVIWGGPDNDRLLGLPGHDTLGGGSGDDSLDGSTGNDAIWTGSGNDTATGGDDNDTLGGAGGDDYLDGGSGDDDLWGSTGSDQLFGGSGNDLLGGFTGDDLLSGGFGDDEIWGSAGNDTAAGGDGADQIGGGADNDYVSGGADNDSLYGGLGDDFVGGGAGDDLIYGAAGDDSLDGGTGNDTIYAGPGADVVYYEDGDGADVLQFFSASEDRLELDDALWTGTLTAAQVVSQFASTVGSNLVLDFGGGDSVTLIGLGGVTSFDSQIDIV